MKITEIKQHLSIENILRHYNLVPDKNNRLTCPWHPDKTPSLQLYPKTNSWTCFSSNCNAGSGDQIDFIMKYENISKYEAIQKATSLIGHTTAAPIPSTTPKEEKPQEELLQATLSRTARTELSRSETLQLALDYFTAGIKSNSTTAKNYIQSRGLEKLSGMGNYPMGYNSGQLHHRENSKYIPDYVNVGLLQNNPSGGYRVFAKHCLMFPLKNKDGQVVSFYGRSIAATGNNKHYYLKNSQGLYPTYPPAGTQKLLITESIIDTATLLQINSITSNFTLLAAYGTNRLTQEHLEAISRLTYLSEIVFFFDGDDAGRRAVTKYAEQIHFLLPKVSISHIETPDDEDPNSLYVTYEEGYIMELLNNRKQLYSTEGKTVKEEQSEVAPKLNSKNHEALVYETTELHFTVLGGIKISGLERMKVTLKIAVKNSHYAPIRQHLDLYNNEQLTRLVRTINEQLDVKTEVIREGLLALIEELEAYRIERLSQTQSMQEESPALTPTELTKAEEYLKADNLMQRLMDDLGKTGVVGEIHNRLIMYLVYLSRITQEPLHIISFGASGTGKTHLQESIGNLLPEEDKLEITSLSGNALYYFKNDEIRHKVLLIEDMDGAQDVLYPLRELQTKQKLTKTVSIKDSQGNIKTIKVTVHGPVCIAGCTTKSRIYEDNANRSLLIHLDGSSEQDDRIMAYQRAEAAGQINKDEEESYTRLLRNIQRMVRPIKVINPYAPQLQIPGKVFKKRRSNWIYLRFIEIITLIHQYQREEKADTDTGEVYIESTLEDIAWANKLLKDILLRKADELSEPSRNFFERLKKWLKESKKSEFRTQELRTEMSVTASSLKRYLPELTSCGLVQIIGGNKTRGYTYEVSSYEEYKKLKHSIDHVLDSLLEQLQRKEHS